ncbi:MAG TPA: SDR family NAD(P)-dependent oxidoreductase [Candidatus Binataceae bacterium]|jgi:NAD(P)-dependent dehydrogenase (short-subunit alcohol dehydrogenase family)|nr:SDR family NAD(P)-dependent oxidoreductase [Candidatus Binataceae bacterium]
MSLHGRTAVITGGASGIGLAISQRLAQDGASVAVFDVDYAGAERLVKQLQADGSSALAVKVDVSDRRQVDGAVREVRDKLGPIQVLVNCAGIEGFEPFQSITEASWDRIMAVNLKGTFNCTQAVVSDMIAAGWGRIINISSSSAQSGAAKMTHYAASKAGVIGFTKALALELGRAGITVNTIPPGSIDTPMLRRAAAAGHLGGAGVEQIAAAMPVGRAGTPEDIAAACAFLASGEAGYITGQVIGVNGGRYM